MSGEESDLDGEDYSGNHSSSYSEVLLSAEKRAHHNALERKRRDHIKDRFNCLKDAIPAIRHEKAVSRAQILKKAAEYIVHMKEQHSNFNAEIEALKRQNALLESQCQAIETQRLARNDHKGIMYDS